MEKGQLIDYLRIVSRIEGELYLLREKKKECENTIRSLCIPIKIEMPEKASPDHEIETETSRVEKPIEIDRLEKVIEILIPIGLPLIPLFFFSCACNENCSYFNTTDEQLCNACTAAWSITQIPFFIYAAVAILTLVIVRTRDNAYNDKNARAYSSKMSSIKNRISKKYEETHASNMQRYKHALSREEQRIANEKRISNHLTEFTLIPTEKQIKVLEAALDQLYSLNIIHPPYRNLVATAQLLDYFQYDMCTQLEGPNGAYLQYQADLRAEHITTSISKLQDAISGRMDAIIENQYTMHSILKSVNSSLSSIQSSLSGISSQLYSVHRSIDSLAEAQVTSNEYMASVHGQLQRIADSYDRNAIETASIGANQRLQMLEQGISEYKIKYPS